MEAAWYWVVMRKTGVRWRMWGPQIALLSRGDTVESCEPADAPPLASEQRQGLPRRYTTIAFATERV